MNTVIWTTVGNVKGRHIPDHVNRSPLPTIDAYAAWLAEQNIMTQRHWTAAKLRTIVRLRRQHETWTAIAQIVGKATSTSVTAVFATLPEELR